MDDVWRIVFIAGALLFVAVKEARKKARQRQTDTWGMPSPQAGEPMTEPWGGMEPMDEPPAQAPRPEPRPKPDETSATPRRTAPPREGVRTTRPTPAVSQQPPVHQDETTDVDIRSVDDVRRGIIWSEILNRKY